jgi:hypothetical protein
MNDQQFKEFMELHKSMDWKLWEIMTLLKERKEQDYIKKDINKPNVSLEGLFANKKK